MPDAVPFHPAERLNPSQTFNVVILSEGYTDQAAFVRDCLALRDQLLAMPPFSLTLSWPFWLAMHHYFVASDTRGPAINAPPAAGTTAFDSWYDTPANRLILDNAKVQQAIDNLDLDRPGNFDLDMEHVMTKGSIVGRRNRAVVVVLLPAVDPPHLGVDMEHEPIAEQYPYVAVTANAGYPQAAARAIARTLGLGDEYTLGPPNPEAPSPAEGERLDITYPNLVYIERPAGTPPPVGAAVDSTFKWVPYIPFLYGETLPVYSYDPNWQPPASPTSTDTVALFEGGGGYRNQVYRPALDCLLARRPGSTTWPVTWKPAAFCPICRRYLAEHIRGKSTPRPFRPRTMATQTLKFDEEAWVQRITVPLPVHNRAVRGAPAGLGAAEPYWEFRFDANANVGLRLQDIVFHASHNVPGHVIQNNTLELLDFPDLEVTFNDGTVASFNRQAAITGGRAKLELAEDGGDMLQHGLRLEMEDDFGGRARVRVVLAVCFRSMADDFDPGGAFSGMKVYPQIGMTWFNTGTHRVVGMRGSVRFIAIPDMVMPQAPPGPNDPANMLSFFTDSNTSHTLVDNRELRRILGFPIEPLPDWAYIFDYFQPELGQERQIVGVYGPADELDDLERHDKHIFPRGDAYTWGQPAGTKILLQKMPRQGDYDNVHIHHFTGKDAKGRNLITAPFCGMACIHLHWRWGPFSAYLAGSWIGNSRPELYRGWGGDPERTQSASLIAAPLIPPNQHLTVAITAPDRERVSRQSIIGDLPSALDRRRKGVWYVVDVTEPLPAGQQQVILEQGLGAAVNYAASFLDRPILNLRRFVNAVVEDKIDQAPGESDEDFRFRLITRLYNVIRYFFGDRRLGPPVREQIPYGDHRPDAAKPSMEDL